MKNRLQALSQLDRALAAMTDEDLTTLLAAIPDDHRDAIDRMCGAHEGGFDDPAARVVAVRTTVARGRMSGALEQIATVLSDLCLADAIEVLGANSDHPTEAQIQEIVPGLIERHGLPTVRLTFAASVAGEAAASVTLTRLLKHDEVLALPAPAAPAPVVVLSHEADDDTKARRKALKERKQADARARREQALRAKNRI